MGDSPSWVSGPTNDRAVRVLLYLAYGSVGSVGVFVVAVAASVLRTGPLAAARGLSFGVLALALLLVVWRGLPLELARRSGGFETNVLDAFAQVRRWRWVAAVSLLAFGAFAGVVLASGVVVLGLLLPLAGWLTGYSLAQLLSSTGEVDVEARTLTYEATELDLDALAGVRRFRLGDRTVLWLSFEPGYSAFDRRLYVLPTPVAERSRSAFEIGRASGMGRTAGVEAGKTAKAESGRTASVESGRVPEVESERTAGVKSGRTAGFEAGIAETVSAKRQWYRRGAVAFSVAGVGVFGLFWWAGAPLGIAALAGAMAGIPALALLAATLRLG